MMIIIVGYCQPWLRRAAVYILPHERGEYNDGPFRVSRPFLVLMVMIFNHPFLSPSIVDCYMPPSSCPAAFQMYNTRQRKSRCSSPAQNISINTATSSSSCCCCGSVYQAGETAIIPPLPTALELYIIIKATAGLYKGDARRLSKPIHHSAESLSNHAYLATFLFSKPEK